MRNVLRALLAVGVALSFRALAAEAPGGATDGVAVDSERTIVEPREAPEPKPGPKLEELGGGTLEPVPAPAEDSGYGADELPSRE